MEEDKINVSGEAVQDNTDYITAIKELKENSVSKEMYAELKQKNKQLLDALVSGETIQQTVETKPVDLDELRRRTFQEDQTNLEYITNALALRQAVIDKGGVDPFVPNGLKIVPTDEDIAAAQRVADVLQECVDLADGDSAIFTNELQRRMVDTAPSRRR